MTDDKPEEEKEPEKREPKTSGELVSTAHTFVTYLKDQGFAIEESLCVLTLASSFTQVELMMKLLLKDAKVMKVPINPSVVMVAKPSDN